MALAIVAITCIFANLWIEPAIASPSNQDLNQPATLVAPDPSFAIKVYDQPNMLNSKNELGYGLSGDPVTLLQQVGGNNSELWYLVKFDTPAKTKGWVSENYISVISKSTSSGQYLGNQKQNSQNQQNQQGSYNQR